MKKTIFMAALGMSVLALNTAQAADFAPYVGLKTGISHVVNKAHSLPEQDDNLWFGSIALGADFREMDVNSNLLLELEYTYRPSFSEHSTAGTDVSSQSQSLMLNGYYVIPARMEVKPYISAGLGFSRNDRDVRYLTNGGARFSKKADSLTWSLGAGALIPEVMDYTDIIVGYRYLDMGSMKTGWNNVDFRAHEFYAGINYKF